MVACRRIMLAGELEGPRHIRRRAFLSEGMRIDSAPAAGLDDDADGDADRDRSRHRILALEVGRPGREDAPEAVVLIVAALAARRRVIVIDSLRDRRERLRGILDVDDRVRDAELAIGRGHEARDTRRGARRADGHSTANLGRAGAAARPTLIGTNRHAGRELFTRLGRRVRANGVRGVRPAVYRLPAGDDRTAGRTTILARLGLADLAAAD